MDDRMERKMDYRKLIGTLILILFLAACGTPTQSILIAPASPPVTITDDIPPAVAATPTQNTPISEVTLTPLPSTGDGLLVVNTKQGLWTAKPDGSDGALRITGPLIIPGPLAGAISSVDGNFAYLTSSDYTKAYGNYPGLTLNIISLFGRGPFVSLPLTSPETEPGAEYPSDILRAMVEHRSFAWSPEGTRLAYIGAAQGPSADVYEYLRGTGAVLRLTDGPDQAYAPQWSPDGKWVVHTAAAGFGTGAGIPVTGMYAARPDGSGTISLYATSEHSGGEYVLGWLNAHTLVTNTWFITCGPSDIRYTDLDLPKTNPLFKGCVSATAVGAGSILFAQSPDTARIEENPQPGLWIYISSANVGTQTRISDADIREISWSEGSGSFLALAADNRLFEITPSGIIRSLAENEPMLPTVSPDGRFWAYSDASHFNSPSGVWIGEYGQALRQIFTSSISPNQILFSTTGDALYFLDAAGNLYRAAAPEWGPVLMVANLQPAGAELAMAWVEEQ
jgi:hypothetical protein